jgi:hypothetical protein
MKKLLQYRVGLRYMEESVLENYGFNNGVAVLLVFERALLVTCVTQYSVFSSLIIPIQ